MKSSSENGERLLETCAERSRFPWCLGGKAVGTPSVGLGQMYRVDLLVEQAAPLICELLVLGFGCLPREGPQQPIVSSCLT